MSWSLRILLLAGPLAVLAGCEASDTDSKKTNPDPAPTVKKIDIGPGVVLEVQGKKRRVLVQSIVCLRKGPLEMLLTRKGKKEHEAILSADVDARKIHEALILAGAEEGKPVRWAPVYRAPSGTPIKITLEYEEKGKKVSVNARTWIRNSKTMKDLDSDWVFAASMLVDDPFDAKKPKMYLANEGDVICVSNFETAMLDVPVKSSKDDADRAFEANTERIPAEDTKVVVILEPVVPEKKK